MKTKLLLTLVFVVGFIYHHWAQTSYKDAPAPNYPFVEVVVTQEKIWLMPDERPLDTLPVQVVNAEGEVVMQQLFCSKTKDWSMDIADLPTGKYKILIGSIQTEYLEKQYRKRLL